MNISPIFRILHKTLNCITPKVLSELTANTFNRKIHYACGKQLSSVLPSSNINNTSTTSFLQPTLPIYNLVCGMKMKTVLHRRCKSCVFVWKHGRKYVMCNEHPRHKQVQRQKKEYKTWILTHATQSRVRPW